MALRIITWARSTACRFTRPIDDDGRFTHTADLPADQQVLPAEMLGKSILEKLGKRGQRAVSTNCAAPALLHQENYHYSYPHCWRGKNPVIFRATPQWFIYIDATIPRAALAAIDQIPGCPPGAPTG